MLYVFIDALEKFLSVAHRYHNGQGECEPFHKVQNLIGQKGEAQLFVLNTNYESGWLFTLTRGDLLLGNFVWSGALSHFDFKV